MKRIHYIATMLMLGITLYSCKDDFLDVKKVEANVPVELLYKNYTYAQEVVWNTYNYLPDGFRDVLPMEGATDNAENTFVATGSQAFNLGIWNQYSNPDNVWERNFAGIRQANLFLKNKAAIDINYIKDKITSTDSTTYFNARDNIKFMEGEVLFLKAFFYFELVKRYGGVPIIDKALDYNDQSTWKNLPRNSVDECLKYIVSLCDKAAAIIPQNTTSYAWYENDIGRVTYGAIKALKARTTLYGASPLYKEAGSTISWADAAKAANDIRVLSRYSLNGTYLNLFNGTISNELIFYRLYGGQNFLEFSNFPIIFEGSNGNSLTPSQNFVDNFEVLVKDGSGTVTGSVPFNWNNPVHAANPYANRDPRLGFTVISNGTTFKSTVIQTYTGGNSGLPKQNATKTGYYLSKWVNPTVDLVNRTTTNHTWTYFRYGEVLLNYAEAMYNAYGATGDPQGFGMTALQAINLVRNGRTTVKMPSIVAADLTQARIEQERNVELGFEGHRFWDIRRWKKGSTYFKAPLNRIEIINTAPSTFTYTVKKLEDRTYNEKMNWYPIPQSEITKTGWTQNPNWN